MKLRATLALVLAAAVGLVAGSAAAQWPGVTPTEIKIGNTNPYSGPASAYGTIGKVIAAYFRKVNEEGGINGRKINFISYDDSYSPPKTVEMVRRLVEQDQVAFVFQTLGTPTNSAIHKYLNQQKVPQLFVATGATKWGDPKNFPWTMGWQPTYQTEGQIYAQYVLKNVKDAKIGILYQNDDYGKDYVEGFKKALGAKASQVIVREATYASTDASVSAQVTQLKESGADTFFLVATPKFATQALITATQIGWKPTILLNSVSQSIPAVLDPAAQQGADLSNVITTIYIKDPGDPQWANDKAIQQYLDFMKKYYPDGNPKDGFNVYGYAVAQTLVEGVLKRAGNNLTRENIMKQATSIKDLRIDVLLPGILINTSPVDSPNPDYYPIQAEQLAKYNPSAKKWDLFGEVIDVSKKK
ncbi:MAG: ABC transporter substrate-binding protein [Dehalococcoidia bacterium]|nr:ABC transporter substrate-binding protein [Dehalococcoidia bacterium]